MSTLRSVLWGSCGRRALRGLGPDMKCYFLQSVVKGSWTRRVLRGLVLSGSFTFTERLDMGFLKEAAAGRVGSRCEMLRLQSVWRGPGGAIRVRPGSGSDPTWIRTGSLARRMNIHRN